MIEGKLKDTSYQLRYGMVGGGPGSFIGPVHRAALAMNNQARLVAGSFSDAAEKTLEVGRELDLDPERTYVDYHEMAAHEGSREDRIDFVVIATPNHLHFPVAKAFLDQGIHVVCEKPLAYSLEEAMELVRLTREKKVEFMVTYTYTGYPMAREARQLIASGTLGAIRVVVAEYPQDWLVDLLERSGHRQASWRTDPQYAGISGCIGDIGTHVENIVHFMTGLEIERLAAFLEVKVPGRALDDNGFILLRYRNGASGNYWASQVATGSQNGLYVRVYGTEGGLEWEQENPNTLRFHKKGDPMQILSRGGSYLSSQAGHLTRVPMGHPEGYFEAFANLYRCYCNVLAARREGRPADPLDFFPGVEDGARGIKFVADCVRSSNQNAAWVDGSFQV